jgi:prefoldin subunit 5
VDEVLMPGQVSALRRRIELLTPTYDRLAQQLKRTIKEAPAALPGEEGKAAADKVARQANRIKAELDTVGREIETLRALVAARLSRGDG